MSGQLAVQSGTQSPKTVGKILFNRKLASQLSVDDLDQLMNGIVKVLKNLRDLLFLVSPRYCAQGYTVLFPQFACDCSTNVGFVVQHLQICMLTEQFKTSFQIRRVSRRQFKSRITPFKVTNKCSRSPKKVCFFVIALPNVA